MAKNFSKKFYNGAKWKHLRKQILQRDFYMCRICGKVNSITVHHIVELTPMNIDNVGVTLNPDNLITVCEECHNMIHDRYHKDNTPTRYTFDAEGNIIPTETADSDNSDSNRASGNTRYTREQMQTIESYKARLKVGA